jgi:hypothetical protein
MTAAQFVRRSETYTRETSRAYVTFLLPSLIFVPGIGVLTYVLAGVSGAIGTAVFGVAWFMIGWVLLGHGAYWRARALGLLCPDCHRPFSSPSRPPDVHGNCRTCGTELIDAPGAPERAMFSRHEFARGQARALRFQRGLYGGWMVLIIGLAVAFPLALALKLWPRSFGNPEIWFGLATLGLVGVGGIVVSILETTRRRRALLECPDCRTQLVNEYGEAALADGRCPGCGLLIVDDTEVVKPAPLGAKRTAPASAQELWQRHEELEYGTRFEYSIVLPLAITGIIVAEVLLWTNRRLSVSLYVGMLIGTGAMVAILLYANRIWTRRARRLGLTCPVCGELLVGGPQNVVARFVAEHGACKFCGAILWGAAPAVPPSH